MTKRSRKYFENKKEVKQWATDWVNFHASNGFSLPPDFIYPLNIRLSNGELLSDVILPNLNINYITPESVEIWREKFRNEVFNRASNLEEFFTPLRRIQFFLEIDAADIHDAAILRLLDAQCDLAMYYQLEEQLTKDLS